jgi:hypothetical protein
VLLAAPEGSDVHRLSSEASAAWRHLDRPRTVGELAALLSAEFSIGRAEIDDHVQGLLDDLEAGGWLVRNAGEPEAARRAGDDAR